MRSQKQTPVWPYLIVLTCLFVLSVTAPRAWEDKADQLSAIEGLLTGEAPADDTSREDAPTVPVEQAVDGAASAPLITRLPAVDPMPAPPAPMELALPFANQVLEPTVEVAHLPTASPPAPEMQLPREEAPALVHPPRGPLWQTPTTLITQLENLLEIGECASWAERVQGLLAELSQRVQLNDGSAPSTLAELRRAAEEGSRLAHTVRDPNTTMLVLRAQYALVRRLDVWDRVPGLGLPGSLQVAQVKDPATPTLTSSPAMTLCLAEIATLTAKESQGPAWREYLLLDRLRSAAKSSATSDDEKRQLAQQVLRRLAQARRSPPQRRFLDEGPLVTLGEELRRWSVEPADVRQVLADIEQFENAPRTTNSRRLAEAWRSLHWSSSAEDRKLADRLDSHYRNANVRVAVSGSLVNRFVPQPAATSAPVSDTIAGADVQGWSTTFTKLFVRLLPDPRQLRLGFEASGLVDSDTAASSGPATFYSNAQASFLVRKLVVVGAHGLQFKPAAAEAENYYMDLRSVETNFDGLPLVGPMVRNMARSQREELLPQAQAESDELVAVRARAQLDAQIEPRLRQARQEFERRVLAPVARLSLDLTPVELATTEDRLIARLRLAGEEQLGAHTPRPRAMSDSLVSFQLHESALNNAIEHLDLAGRKFTLPELMQSVGKRLSLPSVAIPDDLPDDVVITFAGEDAMRVRCDQGRMEVTLAVAELSQGKNRWRNFIARAYYRPEIASPQARLVREGGIELDGESVKGKPEVMLRGIFSKAFSKSRPWNLVPEKLAGDSRFRDLEVTQFSLEDGWIGIAYAAKRVSSGVAKKNASSRK